MAMDILGPEWTDIQPSAESIARLLADLKAHRTQLKVDYGEIAKNLADKPFIKEIAR